MSETKHTPGPWHIPSHLSGADGIGPRDGYDIITCCCCGGVRGDSKEQEIANSRLIVAAPELLEALQEIMNQTDGRNNSVMGQDRAYSIARAAIAKAKGEQL